MSGLRAQIQSLLVLQLALLRVAGAICLVGFVALIKCREAADRQSKTGRVKTYSETARAAYGVLGERIVYSQVVLLEVCVTTVTRWCLFVLSRLTIVWESVVRCSHSSLLIHLLWRLCI